MTGPLPHDFFRYIPLSLDYLPEKWYHYVDKTKNGRRFIMEGKIRVTIWNELFGVS